MTKTPTQADREAAANCVSGKRAKQEILDGVWDHTSTLQAFAHHAQQARLEERGKRERTLTDPQRLLWRDDVEGICPTPGVCWEYGETARCGPCAIEQARRAGIESNMSLPNLPEVYRLRRELDAIRKGEAHDHA